MKELALLKRRRQARSRRPKKSLPFEEKYLAILNALRHSNKEQRRALLLGADKKLVKYICECALNVLSGVIKLTKSQKEKLKKYKTTLRKLITLKKKC